MPLPEPARNPPTDLHAQLNEACKALDMRGLGNNMRVALAAVLGYLQSLTVTVDEVPDGEGGVVVVRRLVAVARDDLPWEVIMWLNGE